MAFLALLFKGLISVGGAGVAVGGSGAVIYYTTKASTKQAQRRQNNKIQPSNKFEPSRETPTNNHETSSKPFVLVLASASSLVENISTDLYDKTKNTKNYTCQYGKDGSSQLTYDDCEIYQLNGSTGLDTVDLPNAIKADSQIKDKSKLVANKNLIVKLSKDIATKLQADATKTFKLVNKSNNAEILANLTWKYSITNEESKVVRRINTSKLLAIKLTKDYAYSTALNNAKELTCQVGEQTLGNCKIYKSSMPTAAYTHESLKTLTRTIESKDTNLKTASFLIVELIQSSKSFNDLDNKTISIKDGRTEVAEGILDNLLIGSTSDKVGSSYLFKLSDVDTSSTRVVVDATPKNYIITKGADVHKALQQTLTGTDYLCRVVEGSNKYDDESCKLFSLGDSPKSTAFAFKKEHFSDDSKKITAIADLGKDKYQFVQLSKALIDKLTNGKKLQIISKTKKDKAFNNIVVELTKHSDLSKDSESLDNLNTNLFLARIKSIENDVSSQSTSITEGFKLSINEALPSIKVKLHKFASNYFSNNKAVTEFAAIANATIPSSDLVKDHYVVIELTDSWKAVGELQNKELTLSLNNAETKLAKLEYAQILFGNPSHAAEGESFVFPHDVIKDTYIVKKTTDASSLTAQHLATPYRCKFSVTIDAKQHENLDDTCKLISIPSPTTDKDQTTLSELQGAQAETAASDLSAATADTYYKLEVHRNRLFNLSFPKDEPTTFAVEVIPAKVETSVNVYGTFTIEQKIVGNSFVGKTDLFLAKVVAATETANHSDASKLAAAKCSLSATTYVEAVHTNGLDCTLHAVTPASGTDFDKLTITKEAETTKSLTANNYYLIKFAKPQSLVEFSSTSKTPIYHYIQDTNTTNIASTQLTIRAWMGGDISKDKKTYYLSTVTTD